jgi:uncharacterized repeat protein (TIGR01451 family)
MKIFTTFLFTLFFFQLNAQGWDKTFADSITVRTISSTDDGGCIIFGIRKSTPITAVWKLDASGKIQWTKEFTTILPIIEPYPSNKVRIIQDSEGNYWLGVSIQPAPFSTILKLDRNGNTLLNKNSQMYNMEMHVQGNQLILFGSDGQNNGLSTLVRLNTNGDTLFNSPISNINIVRRPFYISAVKNNELLIYNLNDSLINPQTRRLGFDGTIKSNVILSINSFFYPYSQMVKSTDGSYFVADSSYIVKIDSLGRFIWRKNIAIPITTSNWYLSYMMTATNDGGFMAIKNNTINQSLEVQKLSKDGVQISSVMTFYSGFLISPVMTKSIQGGYLVAGNTLDGRTRIIKLSENGYLYSNFIKGNIFSDRDDNCRLSGGDIGTQRVIVVAKKTGASDILALTDSLGRYNLNVDTGTYTISIVNPNKYMTPCTPSVVKTLSVLNQIDSFDFPLKSTFFCGLMQVDIATPRLRRCFNNTYAVNYCNKGTALATDAYVNITLDSLLEFVSAGQPVVSRTGRVYRFNLGNVAINDCRTFDIVARVRCGDSTRLNQTLCVDAKIYPDTLCAIDPNNTWTGASLSVTGTCLGDSVAFQIRNVGTAASSSLQAVTIENETARQYNNVQLAVNGVFTKKYPANGNTWRMSVNQQANHPRSTQPTAFVEGCRTSTSMPFVTGFASNFSNDDADLSFAKNCQAIIGAYDPNDKIGYPLGTGTTKAIGQNQDIEYMIRFQNTGTDTAFTVVVRDTIEANLDIYSIEWGASSHKYKPEIYGQNIVKFTFDNILLVDSFRNEPKSNGYVKFRIKQKKDVAFGTKIQNSAGIYFDFNDPVLTNKTLHTVSKNIVLAVVDKNRFSNNVVKVFPNPSSETTLFELTDTPLPTCSGCAISKTTFELFDIVGKRIRGEEFEGKTYEFHRGSLPSGVYIFKLVDANGIIGAGKLIIQ